MKALFFNETFIEWRGSQMWTGPSAGSCWAHTSPGLYSYVPFPFFLANATAYCRSHGVDCDLYDSWGERHIDVQQIRLELFTRKPSYLIAEACTPSFPKLCETLAWAKDCIGCRILVVGSHVMAHAQEIAELPYVDSVAIGEFEKASLAFIGGDTRKVFPVDMVENVEFSAYRDRRTIANYCDPSVCNIPIQVQLNGARGCPGYRCTFCAWPATVYMYKYRARSAESMLAEMEDIRGMCNVGSWFWDEEVFTGGRKDRLAKLCEGMKRMGIPWSFMARTDSQSDEEFKMMVDSGCVAARLAPETWHQHLLDRVNKRLDAKRSWDHVCHIIDRYPGFHLRLLSMRQLPGETLEEERSDDEKFAHLIERGINNGVRVDRQIANCIPMPGTPLYNAMLEAGNSCQMGNPSEYNPLPAAKSQLAERLGVYQDAVR